MEKRVIYSCPLGNDCETHGETADGEKVIHRCAFYISLLGENPQEPDKPIGRWMCSIPALASLQIETSGAVRGVQAATESFRNESLKGFTLLSLGLGKASVMLQDKPSTLIEE